MIYSFELLIFAFSSLFSVSQQRTGSDDFKLIVEIENIKHTNGQTMQIAVSKKADFLKETPPYQYAVVPTKSIKITETFILPPGEYAVLVYHDLNGNGKMDKNFFGAPSEPYAFSRNYVPVFRAPKFDEVKINLSGVRKTNLVLIQP
jgi:uncharacterized protein (DUF2141 family)